MVKVKLYDSITVAIGPTYREVGWGPFQFPEITRRDNVLLYTFRNCKDSATDYHIDSEFKISRDNGKTQEQPDTDFKVNCIGTKCANGDEIWFPKHESAPEKDYSYPQPLGDTMHGGHTVYAIEDVPKIAKPTWRVQRKHAGQTQQEHETAKVDWPGMVIYCRQGVVVKPAPEGHIKAAPDGTLQLSHYAPGARDPKTMGFIPFHSNCCFKSTDNGRSQTLKNFVSFTPDIQKFPLSYQMEGPGESDLEIAPDGSIFSLIRTGGVDPIYGDLLYVRSEDNGETQSDPIVFDDHGVYPQIIKLKNGITVTTYGRPGISLRYSTDPACKKQSKPIKLVDNTEIYDDDLGLSDKKATCGYTSLVELDDNKLGIAYSYFNNPSLDGIPRKSMMFREIEFIEAED